MIAVASWELDCACNPAYPARIGGAWGHAGEAIRVAGRAWHSAMRGTRP